jgi:hypothetical protein
MLLFSCAVLLNRLVIINRLSNTITLFPGLFFLLIVSAFPLFGALTSITLSLLMLILMLSNLMYTNARSGVANKIFNVGIYLGLMILLFIPNCWFIALVIIGINTLTTIKQRVVFNLLNGILLPIYMAGLILFFIGSGTDAIMQVYQNQFGLANLTLPHDLQGWLTLVVHALWLIVVLIAYNATISKKSIQSIRKANVMTWSLLFVVIIFAFSGIMSLHYLMLLSPALAFYTSEAVLRFKKESNAEMIMILLVILCIVMPFLSA